MKKNKEWAFIELGKLFPSHAETNDYQDNIIKYELLNKVYDILSQLDEPEVKQLYEKIEELESYNDELIRDNNQLRDELDNQEVLSQAWIDKNKKYAGVYDIEYYIPTDKLQNVIMPKQELPVIPNYVAEFLIGKEDYMLYELLDDEFIYDNHDELARWLYNNDEKTNKERELNLVLAQRYGYEVEMEPKYYAKVKGWGINGNDGRAYYSGEFPLSLTMSTESVAHTKDEWRNYGVYEDNADFVKAEELKE